MMMWLAVILFICGVTMLLGFLMARHAEQKIRKNEQQTIRIYKDQILVLSAYRDMLKMQHKRKYFEYTEDDEIIDLNNEVLRHTLDEMGIEDGEYTEEELNEDNKT